MNIKGVPSVRRKTHLIFALTRDLVAAAAAAVAVECGRDAT